MRIPPLPAAPPAKPPPAEIDPNAARDLQRLVIYRDDHVLVLNKPHGLPVQGGLGITHHLDGMLDALRFGAVDRPRLVHRLDRDTSGVLLLARTPGTAARLAAAFRTRAVEKTYWAVVARRPIPPEGRIDLRRSDASGARAANATAAAERDDKEAARAITDYRTLDHAGQKLAWLELRLPTGTCTSFACTASRSGRRYWGTWFHARPDQNNAFAATTEGLSSELHLHARALRLPHPAGGTLLVEAELPPHMTQTFRTLGFHAPAPRPPERR